MSLGNRQYVGENDPVHPRDAIEAVPAAPLTSPAPMARISASALILVGIATVLVAIWGAIVPFIGPTFGFSADGASAWNLSDAHLLLGVLPGAVAFVAGVLILLIAPSHPFLVWPGVARRCRSPRRHGWRLVRRGTTSPAGLVHFRQLLRHRKSASRARVPDRLLVRPGLLIIMAGAFTLGWSARHQRNSSPPVSAASAVPPASIHVVENSAYDPAVNP